MASMADFDKNVRVESKIEREGLEFFDITKDPFSVYGVTRGKHPNNDKAVWERMPDKVAKEISQGVYFISKYTSGGRVRFMTDSPYVAINTEITFRNPLPHLSLIAQTGFDLYVGKEYYKTYVPPFDIRDGYESVIDFPTSEMREITINFPLYYGVEELFIGIKEGSRLEKAPDYLDIKPIVYYGSSITQGGCANRPGNSYEAIIARETNVDFLNLGFGGSALGEESMAEYISSLDMSLFVLDYDHNAPTPEYLEKTHERFFKLIRKAHPSLPILMMSRPVYYPTPEEEKRLEIITKTYENAVNAGDKNVYLIKGTTLFEECKNNGTVDNCHPTDYGFHCMAKKILPVIKEILKLD